MGAGGSKFSEIEVTFNRASLFYFTGERISGNISFQNTQDKLTLHSIFVECVGEIVYQTEDSQDFKYRDGHAWAEHNTNCHRTPFMNLRIPIAQPQYGQREITLYRGQHSWPFEFVLPQSLPPSFFPSTDSDTSVKYFIRVVLDKPWYKRDVKQVYSLTIFPRVNIFHVPGGQQPVAFSNENRKKIRLQGYLIRGGVVPGEKLTIHIDLHNPKRTEIKKIEAILFQHRIIQESSRAEIILRTDLPDLGEFNATELQRTFDLDVPSVCLSPTYTYLSQSHDPSIDISIHYELILDIKVRGFHTDFKVSVPVVLGTEPMTNEQQQQQMNNANEMSIARAAVFTYGEPSPSYETVVADQKI